MRRRLSPLQRGARFAVNVRAVPTLVLYIDAALSTITQADATERVSAWSDLSGNGNNIVQATPTAQPILLPDTGANYLYSSGTNNNNASTPNLAASTLTGDMSAVLTLAPNSVAPTQAEVFLGQLVAANGYNWQFYLGTTGAPIFVYSTDGSALVTKTSSATLASVGLAAFQKMYLGVYHDVDNGASGNDVKFYWSVDKISWTQLGTTQTTVGAVTRFASTGVIHFFSSGSVANVLMGKGYRAELYSGNYFDGSATVPVLDTDFTNVPEGATSFTEASVNAATVTINTSGATPAQIVAAGQPSVLFDGTTHSLKTAAFTLNQPLTFIFVGKAITWTDNDRFIDGDADNSITVYQTLDPGGAGASPRIAVYAGIAAAFNDEWPLNTVDVISVIANGASSSVQVGLNSPATGDAGANNAGGITIAKQGISNISYGNFALKALTVFSSAPDSDKQAKLQRYFMSRKGIGQ